MEAIVQRGEKQEMKGNFGNLESLDSLQIVQ